MKIKFVLEMEEDLGFVNQAEMAAIVDLQMTLAKLFKEKFDAKIEHRLNFEGEKKEE